MSTPHADEDERFRWQARTAFSTSLTMFAVAGIVTVLGYPSAATGLAWFGGGSLLLGIIYVIMHRV